MRCSMMETSKYGYKPKPKQCKHPALMKTVVPVASSDEVTQIRFCRICVAHYTILEAHKERARQNLNKAFPEKRLIIMPV